MPRRPPAPPPGSHGATGAGGTWTRGAPWFSRYRWTARAVGGNRPETVSTACLRPWTSYSPNARRVACGPFQTHPGSAASAAASSSGAAGGSGRGRVTPVASVARRPRHAAGATNRAGSMRAARTTVTARRVAAHAGESVR